MVVNALSLNAFKSRLNKHWYGHQNKFEVRYFQASPNTRVKNIEMHLKKSETYYGVNYR